MFFFEIFWRSVWGMCFSLVVGGGLFGSWFQWFFLLRCKRAAQNLYGKQTRLPSWIIRHQLGTDGNVKLDHFQTSHKCLYLMFSLSNKKQIRVFQVYTKTHPCFLVSFQYTYVFSRFCPKTQARFCLEKKTHARFLFIWKCETQKNTKKHIPFLRRSTSNLEDKARSNRAINLCPCRFGCSIQCHGPIAKKRSQERRCRCKVYKKSDL